MPTHILLADDHRIVRQGLAALLRRDADFQVVAEAGDGAEAVRLAVTLSPDVVVMDVRMPGVDGIDATRQIVAGCPRTKVIGLSGDRDAAASEEMLRAGAAGYVYKDAAVDELAAAIRVALTGGYYFSPLVAGAAATDALVGNGGPRGGPALSPREQQVLRLVADGRSTKQAARDLSVSVKTIETHRRNLMEKLQIDNVADLTKHAIRTGLCSL